MEVATLKGTEKQVSWAKAIRKDRLKVWQGKDSNAYQDMELMLSQQDVASWWIASKDKSLEDVRSQLQSGAKPMAPIKKAAHSIAKIVVRSLADEEVWETVATASGFMRSGPTRDMVTGEVVNDVTLPF